MAKNKISRAGDGGASSGSPDTTPITQERAQLNNPEPTPQVSDEPEVSTQADETPGVGRAATGRGSPWTLKRATALLKDLRVWCGLLVTIVTVAVWMYKNRPTSPKVIFVVLPNVDKHANHPPQSEPANSVSGDLWDGIVKGAARGPAPEEQPILKLRKKAEDESGEQSIEIIPIDDGPDPLDTISRIDNHPKLPNCIMLLAHETSTLAKTVWRDYYKKRDKKLPVILLGPTNPDITNDDQRSGSQLLLRLLPNDDKQVALLSNIIGKEVALVPQPSDPKAGQKALNLFIVTDRDNPVYAKYITSKLITSLRSDVRLCGTAEVATTASLLLDVDRIQHLEPDIIVFVGMAECARAFVQALECEWTLHDGRGPSQQSNSATSGKPDVRPSDPEAAYWLRKVALVFTDGCASEAFFSFLKDNDGRQPWRALYLISTVPPPDKPIGLTELDFKPIGKAAILLATHLSYDAWRQDGKITAESILTQFANRRGTKDSPGKEYAAWDQSNFTAVSDYNLPGSLQSFRFALNGDNELWDWHAYCKKAHAGSKEFLHVEFPKKPAE